MLYVCNLETEAEKEREMVKVNRSFDDCDRG